MTLDLGESSATAAARAAAHLDGNEEQEPLPPAEVLRVQDMLHEFAEVNVLGARELGLSLRRVTGADGCPLRLQRRSFATRSYLSDT